MVNGILLNGKPIGGFKTFELFSEVIKKEQMFVKIGFNANIRQ